MRKDDRPKAKIYKCSQSGRLSVNQLEIKGSLDDSTCSMGEESRSGMVPSMHTSPIVNE